MGLRAAARACAVARRWRASVFCAAMARVCILRARGDGVMLLRCFVRRAASGLALLESILSAGAICARLEALELTRSSCDSNSLSETPTGLSWPSLDAQISN